jgi:hypothetical protein
MTNGVFIHNGVRRALACREAGRKTVPAVVYREGRKPELHPRMRLDRLFSPKATVARDVRFLRIVPPIVSPIEVELLGDRNQPISVPLSRVRLV